MENNEQVIRELQKRILLLESDEEIVWYGSMNLLSGEKEDDNLMGVLSKEIAQELMAISFQKEEKL